MTELADLSLATLKKLEGAIPGVGRFPARVCVSSYEEFVSILYKDLDDVVSDMEENPELLSGDSEDRLTIQIKCVLRRLGYDVSHDQKVGGHCDLLVKKDEKNWKWIGEAKFCNSYSYVLKGFQQLTTRYMPGSATANFGAMLIYIKQNNAKRVMEKWQNTLAESHLISEFTVCDVNPLSFYSIHTHQRTGLVCKVRHIPLILHFNPKDK